MVSGICGFGRVRKGVWRSGRISNLLFFVGDEMKMSLVDVEDLVYEIHHVIGAAMDWGCRSTEEERHTTAAEKLRCRWVAEVLYHVAVWDTEDEDE